MKRVPLRRRWAPTLLPTIALLAIPALAAGATVAVAGAAAAKQAAATGALAGRVTRGKDGSALAGAAIAVKPSQGGKTITAKSAGDGSYRLAGLREGFWDVTASAPGMIDAGSWRVEVRHGESASADLALVAGGRVTGVVVGEDGRPLAGAKLDFATGVRTDAGGRYTLFPVPPAADWTVSAEAPGHVRGDSAKLEVLAEHTTQAPPLRLENAGQLAGQIVDAATRQPLAGASIYAYGDGIEGGSWGSAKTDERGRYRIDGLRSGLHSLNIDREGYESMSGGGATAIKGQEVALNRIELSLRDPMFTLYANQKVFLPNQKPRLYFNAFRNASFSVEVFAIDPLPALRAHGNLEQLAPTVAVAKQPFRALPAQAISYRRVLQELHGRALVLSPLPVGTYLVRAKSARGQVSSTWLQITELALVSKETANEIVLQASDLQSSKARAGVEVTAYPSGQVLGKTDADGILRVDKLGSGLTKTFALWASDSQRAGSAAILHASGEWTPEASAPWRVYFETDRPLYRPGQTVFYKGTVRADELGTYALKAPAEARLEVDDAAGGQIFAVPLTLSASGSFDGEIELAPEAALGVCSVTVKLGATAGASDEVALEGGSFRVEDYRKPELKVAVTVDPPALVGGAPFTATVDASYYFGGPVAGAKIDYEVYATPYWSGGLFADQQPCGECWNGWDDSAGADRGYGELVAHGTATTDGGGRVVLPIPTRRPSGADDLRYRVTVRVADPTGREVEDAAQALVTRAAFALGVETNRYVYRPEDEALVTVRASDFAGKPVATPFTLRLLEERWEKGQATTLDVSEQSAATDAEGRALIRLTPGRAGYLKLYALAKDAGGNLTDTAQYVWSAGEHWVLSEYPFQDLQIVTDQRSYKPGDTARVLVNAAVPDSDVLFTIEGDAVREARVLHLHGASQLVEVPITSLHMPTLHLGATLVARHRFAQAEKAVPVSPDEKILKVRVTPERDTYRPGENAAFTVETRDAAGHGVAAEVSVAVVDEAIFALSRELVPDIRAAFYGPRPNRVVTAYSFPMVYEGGADKFKDDRRRRQFKDTAFWAPRVTTSADGMARVEFQLPDNLTTWRATARAATADTRVGEARGKTVARQELLVRLATPRFLITGDTVHLRAAVHNETAQALSVALRFRDTSTTHAIEPLAATNAALDVAAHGVATWDLPVRVMAAERAKLALDAAGGGFSDGVELELPVYPAGAPLSTAVAGSTDGTARAELRVPEGADPRANRLTVYLAPSLAAGLYDGLDALDTYPYGGIEQTLNGFVPAAVVRRAFNDLGVGPLANAGGPGAPRGDVFAAHPAGTLLETYTLLQKHLPEQIAQGLERLARLQHADGGWGWWQHDPSHPFLTAYAVYGLGLTRESGQHVDEVMLTKGREALERMLSATPPISDQDQRAWILYALARSGDLSDDDRSALLALDDAPGALSPYGRALLTSALTNADAGRAEASARVLLALAVAGTGTLRWPVPALQRYTWVGSDVEATAYAALALLEALPAGAERDGAVESAIRFLVQNRRGAGWATSKDTAAAILATTAWLRERPGELRPAYRVRTAINGNQLAEQSIGKQATGEFMTRLTVDANLLRPGENTLEITKDKDQTKLANGEAKPRVYYSALLRAVLPEVAAQPQSAGFSVAREYWRTGLRARQDGQIERFSEPYDPAATGAASAALHVGDRLEVHVKVRADRDWSFVMVQDPLPSGFEVEDAFGRADSEYSEQSWSWWFARREVRDDKVVFFATIWPTGTGADGKDERQQEFVYTIRAELAGELRALPASAELMYFPEVRGSSASSILRVVQ